jgi:hypothetical protein
MTMSRKQLISDVYYCLSCKNVSFKMKIPQFSYLNVVTALAPSMREKSNCLKETFLIFVRMFYEPIYVPFYIFGYNFIEGLTSKRRGLIIL